MISSNIDGFPNYHISPDGKLYRYDKVTQVWVIMSSNRKNNGYISNILWDGDKKVNAYRHRLVAKAYIPNPKSLPFVCHKDNNKVNNNRDNLYWGTPKDNMGQAVRDGVYKRGWDKRGRCIIDEIKLCNLYTTGVKRKEILAKFGISVGKYYEVLRKHNLCNYGEKDKRNKR